MNKQLINQHLSAFGLDETEIEIYLNLSKYGSLSPLELSRKSGLNRSKIYRYIERLKDKKLVEDIDTGWGLKIRPASLENLELAIQEKETEIKHQKEILPAILTEIKSLTPLEKTDFEVKKYEGLEGLKQMMWNKLSAQKEVLELGYQSHNDMIGKKFAEKIRETQVERKITIYEIQNTANRGQFWFTDVADYPKYYSCRYIRKETLSISQNLAIFNDTVSIMNWSQESRSGLEIVNGALAKMQREIFWEFWKIAEKTEKKIRTNV